MSVIISDIYVVNMLVCFMFCRGTCGRIAILLNVFTLLKYEPVREKTNNLGFRPGLTQTGLYSHRR